MTEYLSFYIDDAIQYGEENAIVLYIIRQVARYPDQGDDALINNVIHKYMTVELLESYFPYKTTGRIKNILSRLKKLDIISIVKRKSFENHEEQYIGLLI